MQFIHDGFIIYIYNKLCTKKMNDMTWTDFERISEN